MNNLNVLIVEDESLIALELVQLVSSFGCNQVKYATHPKKATKLMQEEKINLILMDINLKLDTTGIELYQSFQTDIPVIYITAYNDEETIEKAIQTNPLGYLIKPYRQDELKALLLLAKYKMMSHTKSALKDNDIVTLGEGYTFDKSREKLSFNDIQINLGTKELKLLKLLIDARGYIVNFDTIEEELWSDNFVSASTMRTLIYRLRGKLEYKLIENIYNQGLKLNLKKTI